MADFPMILGLRCWTLLSKYNGVREVTIGQSIFRPGAVYWDHVDIERHNNCRFFRQILGPPLPDDVCNVFQRIHATNPDDLQHVVDLVDKKEIQVLEDPNDLPEAGDPELDEGDDLFYQPFGSQIVWDGANWTGPRITTVLFGRNGQGNSSVWMNSISTVPAYPTPTGDAYGIFIGDTLATGTGGSWKIHAIASTSSKLFTGWVELHADSTLPTPDYNLTGKGRVFHTNSRIPDTSILPTPLIVNKGSFLQCFFRMDSGQWQDVVINVTYSIIADV